MQFLPEKGQADIVPKGVLIIFAANKTLRFNLLFLNNSNLNQSQRMKKIFFTLALTVFGLHTASAQMSLRIFLGANSSTLSDVDSFDFDSKVGYQIGADLQFGSKFYVQPGIQFDYIANTVSRSATGEEAEYKRTNMSIPVMFGYAFGGAESDWGIRLFTGPNATFNLTDNTEGGSSAEELDLNSTIWGWKAGIGADFLSIFFLDIGYQFGLSEVFEDIEDSPVNNLFYGNAGIRLRF